MNKNHIGYQMAKYRANHGRGRPRDFVADQQAKYERVHAQHADPVEGLFDGPSLFDEFLGPAKKKGPFVATITQLQAELRRLETAWAPATIYPTSEAKTIFSAALDISNNAINEGISLRSQPAIAAFSASRNAITRGTDDVQSATTRFLSEMNKPTPEVPQGRPLSVASNKRAEMVNLPALRPGTLSVIRATIRAYETYNTVADAIPTPRLTNTILSLIMKTHSATQATLGFIGSTFGGMANLPDKFREGIDKIGTIIKVSTIAGVGMLLYWALKPKKGTQ